MGSLAVKIAVMEYERGWGKKLDDWMCCLTVEDALKFKTEFNAKNNLETVPDWYMIAEGEPKPIDLIDKQYQYLKEKKRELLSILNTLV